MKKSALLLTMWMLASFAAPVALRADEGEDDGASRRQAPRASHHQEMDDDDDGVGMPPQTPPAMTPLPPPSTPPPPPPPAQMLSFATDVQPILNGSCTVCHNGAREFSLLTLADVLRRVTPGNSANSRLVVATQPGGSMAGYLTPAQANTIKTWVDQGAKP